MAKSFAIVGCSSEFSKKIVKIAKSYSYACEEYSDFDDFRSAFESDTTNSIVVILDLHKIDKSNIASVTELLHSGQNYFATVVIQDEIEQSILDDIEEVTDYDIRSCDEPTELKKILARASRLAVVRRKLENTNVVNKKQHTVEAFLGRSSEAMNVRAMLKKLISAPISSVFISGETGTGKGLTARILHNQDPHQTGSLIEVNCSAIPKDLMESELFGHEAGSFTGAKKTHRGYLEQANEGTLFLDEITEMDVEFQAKLLKALEDRVIRRVGGERDINIDVSIIAATNRDPLKAIEDNQLREDLYHRLNVFCLNLPALRDRKEDLLDLVPSIVEEYNKKSGKHVTTIEDSTWDTLTKYDWPGNIRELRNVIERCVLFSESEVFSAKWMSLECDNIDNVNGEIQSSRCLSNNDLMLSDLDIETSSVIAEGECPSDTPKYTFLLNGSTSLDDMEKEIIRLGLNSMNGNVTETARLLNISREKLRYRIKKYKIDA
tara:strand:- start:102380 stop:103855 length:1476 start_codon:yes stop_codon:yes gene_type:complete